MAIHVPLLTANLAHSPQLASQYYHLQADLGAGSRLGEEGGRAKSPRMMGGRT